MLVSLFKTNFFRLNDFYRITSRSNYLSVSMSICCDFNFQHLFRQKQQMQKRSYVKVVDSCFSNLSNDKNKVERGSVKVLDTLCILIETWF